MRESKKTGIRYRPGQKRLLIDLEAPEWDTPFQKQLIAEIISDIYKVTSQINVKFEYFQEGNNWGFRKSTNQNKDKK